MKTKVIENNTQNSKENFLHKFDQGRVFVVLIKTALPIVILMLFNSAYAFIDSLMSSTFVHYGEVIDNGNVIELNGGTSIGLIFPLLGFLIAFEVMISVGSGLAYTQSMAQKKYVEAQKRHNEALIMIVIMCIIIFFVIAIIGIPYFLTVSKNWGDNPTWGDSTWGNSESGDISWGIIMDGYYYMLILGISFIPMQLMQSFVRVLRAEGKGDAAAIIPILTFPINIVFDYVFMKIFNIGLVGAGLATLIANFTGLIMMIFYVWFKGLSKSLNLKLEIPKFRIQKEIAIVIIVFAMGSLLRRLFDSMSMIMISTFVGNMVIGPEIGIPIQNWTGSWTIMTRSINMGSQVSLGIAQAMSMLISYYWNSKQKEKVDTTLKYGIFSMVICSIATFLILFGLQGILFNAYQPNGAYGWEWFNILSITFIIVILYSILFSIHPAAIMFYAGIKDPKSTLIHSLIFNCILLLSSTLGFVFEVSYQNPIILFSSILIGGIVGFSIVMIIFKYKYEKQIIKL